MRKQLFTITFLFALTFCCFLTAAAQSAPQTDGDKVYLRSEVDKQAIISRKPRPQTGGRCGQGTSGTVVMNLVLRKNARVEIASVLQASNCSYFNDSANKAAMAIQFTPAEKDGQPVSVRVTVEFQYRTY